MMNIPIQPLKDLLFRMADDALIIAHRNSEWTGLGPILEEDIAFSSIAQDKMGHALALYAMLEAHGEPEPDITAFMRNATQFRCCHLTEFPIGEYDFSLIRHLLFDMAEQARYRLLEASTYQPLAQLAKKVRGEIKYHVFHAQTLVVKLGAHGTDESHARMQAALNECFPLALGIFEPSKYEGELIESGIFAGEKALQTQWLSDITPVIEKAGLILPPIEEQTPSYGGRYGSHTEHLQPLLDEMTEVFRLDPAAEW